MVFRDAMSQLFPLIFFISMMAFNAEVAAKPVDLPMSANTATID